MILSDAVPISSIPSPTFLYIIAASASFSASLIPYPSLAKSPLNGKEPKLLSYKELKQEIVCYAKNPSQCIDERSRLREIAHYYLLKRAEEVRNLPIDRQAEKERRLNAELTGIIRTQKAGQNIRSAIQGAISRMGNNDKFHLLESDQTEVISK